MVLPSIAIFFSLDLKKGINDALIQLYSSHETHASSKIFSKLSLADAQTS
jgi:hypothetical protein